MSNKQALADMLAGRVTENTANFAKKQYNTLKEDIKKTTGDVLDEEEFERTMIIKTEKNQINEYIERISREVTPEEIKLIASGKLSEAKKLKDERIRKAMAEIGELTPSQKLLNEDIKPKKEVSQTTQNQTVDDAKLRKLIKEEVSDALLLMESTPKDKLKSLIKECLLEILKEQKSKK